MYVMNLITRYSCILTTILFCTGISTKIFAFHVSALISSIRFKHNPLQELLVDPERRIVGVLAVSVKRG